MFAATMMSLKDLRRVPTCLSPVEGTAVSALATSLIGLVIACVQVAGFPLLWLRILVPLRDGNGSGRRIRTRYEIRAVKSGDLCSASSGARSVVENKIVLRKWTPVGRPQACTVCFG